MTRFEDYKNDLFSLASSLDKLYKVIQHPDPSAKLKQQVLYKKYLDRVQSMGEQIKSALSWRELTEVINGLPIEQGLTASLDTQRIITKRLIKDFEPFYIVQQNLEELVQSPLRKGPQKRTVVKRRRSAFSSPPPSQKYTEESLKELVHYTKQQHQAKKKLQKLVEAIKKVGPDKLEKKINELSNLTKPS
ncbi:MAG: hypothetical protein GY786_17905 [Proteobacteria bacterium]|nr:hypothetical protein [Pseudomonadota bacterium]